MNCVEVQKLLSAYHDGELMPDKDNSVAEHLKACSECAAILAGFQQLSELSQQSIRTEPPEQWIAIQEQLAATSVARPIRTTPLEGLARCAGHRAWLKRFLSRSPLAVAATLLVAAGLGVGMICDWFSRADHHDAQLAANFATFLSQFEGNPQAAEQVLLASYDGEQVDIATATRRLGFRPAIASGLPAGYSVDSLYVLNMPCCKCPQAICRREGKGRLAIFEHHVDQPVWFGSRPAIEARCCGKLTRIVEMDSGLLAATWPSNKRFLTVIGARDVEEVTRLVSYFEGGEQHL